MSGGHFDYQQYRIEDIARSIDELIESNDNDSVNEYGDPLGFKYPKEIIEKFKETAHTLRQAADMAQRVDWLVSGDDGEDSFLTRWEKEVRPYWSNTKNDLIKSKVDKYEAALLKIDEIYVDGDDTYESWKMMGDIARNALDKELSPTENFIPLNDVIRAVEEHPEYPEPCPMLHEVAGKAADTMDKDWVLHMVREACRQTKQSILSDIKQFTK